MCGSVIVSPFCSHEAGGEGTQSQPVFEPDHPCAKCRHVRASGTRRSCSSSCSGTSADPQAASWRLDRQMTEFAGLYPTCESQTDRNPPFGISLPIIGRVECVCLR